jgi:hypothetical protein
MDTADGMSGIIQSTEDFNISSGSLNTSIASTIASPIVPKDPVKQLKLSPLFGVSQIYWRGI